LPVTLVALVTKKPTAGPVGVVGESSSSHAVAATIVNSSRQVRTFGSLLTEDDKAAGRESVETRHRGVNVDRRQELLSF
jgi:hypothetical protein